MGRRIGQYEIVARLGGGGMGVVYKALDGRLGRPVALKFLPQQWSDDESAKQRFVREAQAASATDHPNICTIHDIGSADDGRLFIVMAYYEGQTLKQRLESGPLPVDEALEIATQVGEGLAKAHAQRVVHRDIKPANLILTADGVRIVDFGLAKFADTVQLTVVGSTLGTAAYMSPEQVKGEETDARSDVWALGIVLYEMLVGHPPFRGSYVEAISYAIRSDTPAPLRAARPEIPEEVEQIVFRALHKDPAVRYQSGRDFARALRQARGLTVPLDLRTQVVHVPPAAALRGGRRLRRWLVVAALMTVLAAAGAWWAMRPAPRLPVLVLPVANQTGFTELEPYRLALTYQLLHELADSPNIRVLSWPRLLQTLRGVMADGTDISSLTTSQTLAAGSGVQTIVASTLLWEGQKWQVRVEVRAPGVRTQTYLSEPTPSALPKDTAYRLMADAARLIEEHFSTGWIRREIPTTPTDARLRGLDAAKAFEQGIRAYEDQEYVAALASFQSAANLDPQNALVQAWVSRVARVVRRDALAGEAGRRAIELQPSSGPSMDRLFVESVAAEARGDLATAEARLRELANSYGDDTSWQVELAALVDRRAQGRDAWEDTVTRYHDVLRLDADLIRPRVELCRLYNRLNDVASARKAGGEALAAATQVRWAAGEVLARLCLADALRGLNTPERQQAREHANRALSVAEQFGLTYNRPRALYYLGLVAGLQRDLEAAVRLYDRSLTAADEGGNEVLKPLLFNNLGVAHERLGNGELAAKYYISGAQLAERFGDQHGAAIQQFNNAALRIRYSEDSDSALRGVENALEVFRALGDVNFEILSRGMLAFHSRLNGRFAEADQRLNQALALARERNALEPIASITLSQAALLYDKSDYPAARTRLVELTDEKAGTSSRAARVLLARVDMKLGDFAGARRTLTELVGKRAESTDRQSEVYLDTTLGLLELEVENRREARRYLEQASRRWTETFTDSAAVEARAYLGWLDVQEGRAGEGLAALEASLDWARRKNRVWLETTSRVLLARAHLVARDAPAAVAALVPLDKLDAAVGTELRMLGQYWRDQALKAQGRPGSSDGGRALLDGLRASLPAEYRDSFMRRPDIQTITNEAIDRTQPTR